MCFHGIMCVEDFLSRHHVSRISNYFLSWIMCVEDFLSRHPFLRPFCGTFAALLRPFCGTFAALLRPFCGTFATILLPFCGHFAAFCAHAETHRHKQTHRQTQNTDSIAGAQTQTHMVQTQVTGYLRLAFERFLGRDPPCSSSCQSACFNHKDSLYVGQCILSMHAVGVLSNTSVNQ